MRKRQPSPLHPTDNRRETHRSRNRQEHPYIFTPKAEVQKNNKKVSIAEKSSRFTDIFCIFALCMNFFRTTTLVIGFFFATLLAHAQYRVECEDTCNHVHGLDISHYQGTVFWQAIGDNSKQFFVYLKASEGGTNIDRRYLENIQTARRYGLKVGSYHFYRARMPQNVQLANFKAQCRPQDQDLVPMIDVEVTSGLSKQALRDSLQKFLILVERAYRCKPIVYTYTSFYNDYLQGAVDGYLLWIAQYNRHVPKLRDGRDIFAWQYTEKGRINGVKGYVDKNRLLGRHSMREIRYRYGHR